MEPMIRQGGLFRCCIQTAVIRVAEAPSYEGDELQCPHCKAWMIFKNDSWEWNDVKTQEGEADR